MKNTKTGKKATTAVRNGKIKDLQKENEVLREEIMRLASSLAETQDSFNILMDALKVSNFKFPDALRTPLPRKPRQTNKMVSVARVGTGNICIGKSAKMSLKDWEKYQYVSFFTTEFRGVYAMHFTEEPTAKSVKIHDVNNTWYLYGITYIIEKLFGHIPAESRVHYNAEVAFGSDDTLIIWPNDIAFCIPQNEIKLGGLINPAATSTMPCVTINKDGRCRINAAARSIVSNSCTARYVEIVTDPKIPQYVGIHFCDVQTPNSIPLEVAGSGTTGGLEFCCKALVPIVRTDPKRNSTRFSVISCPNCGTTIMLDSVVA